MLCVCLACPDSPSVATRPRKKDTGRIATTHIVPQVQSTDTSHSPGSARAPPQADKHKKQRLRDSQTSRQGLDTMSSQCTEPICTMAIAAFLGMLVLGVQVARQARRTDHHRSRSAAVRERNTAQRAPACRSSFSSPPSTSSFLRAHVSNKSNHCFNALSALCCAITLPYIGQIWSIFGRHRPT